jgi:cellulose synthase/poly-beta-1,6-N-acetylglucosamine synthase-like glycosyltransferase
MTFELIFWMGPLAVLYAYIGFPKLAAVLAGRRPQPLPTRPADGVTPSVTVIVCAYNEERNIGARIRNVLDSHYPAACLDVIVVSDASTDSTNETARSIGSDRVRLLVQEHRRGKTAGLNLAMRSAVGDIVVFTDANASFPPGAVRALVAPFEDPAIGLVSGYTKYGAAEGGVASTTNTYTALERTIKRAESRWGCCVGADGAIFAMRRSLYRELRDDDINDFVLPLSVIGQGYRCVLSEAAFCSEQAGQSLESEFRRQSRITNRSLRALWRHAHLLNPLQFPLFSFFLFSHKVVRFLSPVLLCASAGALVLLAPRGGFYLLVLALSGMAAVATVSVRFFERCPVFVLERPRRLLSAFAAMNVAMLHGWWRFVGGNREVTWQHDRALNR